MGIINDIKRIISATTNTTVELLETTETIAKSAHSLARAGEHYANSVEYNAEVMANTSKSLALATRAQDLKASGASIKLIESLEELSQAQGESEVSTTTNALDAIKRDNS